MEQRDHIYERGAFKETQTTRYTYTNLNQTSSLTRAYGIPESRLTSFTYTPTNRLESKSLPDGTTLKYSYNELGYLEELTSSGRKKIHHTFTYNKLGQLASATDEVTNSSIYRKIDPFGNLLREEFPNNLYVETAYDAFNRPLSIELSGYGRIDYAYDPLYLRTVTRKAPRGDPLYVHTYDHYDLSGNLTSETLIGDLGRIEHAVDLKGRKIAITSSYFSQSCCYDPADNLTQAVINGENYSYTYDELSQLTSEATPEALETLTNDSNYNQTRKNGVTLQINPLNELLAQGSTTCRYDLNGNQTLKTTPTETFTYTYDPLNRLIKASNAQDACKVKSSLKASMLSRGPEANQALVLACF